MAGVVGKSGRKSDKHWRDALMVAVNRQDLDTMDKRTMLAKIAEKCVEAALGGDMQAIREIGDRLDGKAHQSLDVTTTHERSAAELTESELDVAIARLRAIAALGGKAPAAPSPEEPNSIH